MCVWEGEGQDLISRKKNVMSGKYRPHTSHVKFWSPVPLSNAVPLQLNRKCHAEDERKSESIILTCERPGKKSTKIIISSIMSINLILGRSEHVLMSKSVRSAYFILFLFLLHFPKVCSGAPNGLFR